jgi:hypothetical protein
VEKCGKAAHITEEPESKDDFICGEMRKNQLILLKNQKAKTTLSVENVENQLILLKNQKAKTTLSVEKYGKPAHITEEPDSKDDFYLWRNAENQLILLKNQKAKTALAVEK